MKIQIRNRWTNACLWEGEAIDMRDAVQKAVASLANLRDADLREADLRGADLREANLRRANLMSVKADVWEVLRHAIPELPLLAAALREGRVDGSTYLGPCACLCATIANARHAGLHAMRGITPDVSRPAEQFFLAIRKGDTPATNPASRLALEWVEDFERLIHSAGAHS